MAHFGADRFAVVFPDLKSESELVRLLEETRWPALARPFAIEDQELRMSTKIGIALCPNDGTSADTLFRNSEAARRSTPKVDALSASKR